MWIIAGLHWDTKGKYEQVLQKDEDDCYVGNTVQVYTSHAARITVVASGRERRLQ